ncbi:MAG: polymerase, partial [Chloroflexi bacterium]|nr:polymerase [Chloroflexota bacterium]
MAMIVLVDGNSLVHRAFHALPPLTSPKGELTNATYGFTMMLLKAIDDLHPTHIAAAFDTPRPTFRHERFDAYKGTRAPTADGLRPQFPRVLEVLDVLHIPVFRQDGLEADDLLGTLADLAAAQEMDVIVITGDTDALQLVGPRVRVLTPRRGLTDTVIYDADAVRERYGLEPAQLVDLRALRGDVSDNIPGVPGIGEKTAAKLLATYGDIEAIIASLDKLPVRQADQLRPFVDQMRMARDLAAIVRDAPIEVDFAQCVARPADRDRALPLFHDLGFRTLVDRLPTERTGLVPSQTSRAGSSSSPTNGRGSSGGAQQATLFDQPPSREPSSVAAPARMEGDGRLLLTVEELRGFAE